MSILPTFATVDVLAGLDQERGGEAVESGKNPVFDFKRGEFVRTATGRIAEVDDVESLKVWASKALMTARDHFLIYSRDYGNEAFDLIGIDLPDEIIFTELERLITEALVYDPRVSACTEFHFTREADRVQCEFTLVTPLGGSEQMSYSLEVS